MNKAEIAMVGSSHLGLVYSACLATLGNKIFLFDQDAGRLSSIADGSMPVIEPNLPELFYAGMQENRITIDPFLAHLDRHEIVWLVEDVELDSNSQGDVSQIIELFGAIAPHLRCNSIVLISSQIPVGTCEQLQRSPAALEKSLVVGYVPENLRLGTSIGDFWNASVIYVGVPTEDAFTRIELLFQGSRIKPVMVSPKDAEMIKHGINTFLALAICFGNEIGVYCNSTGADPGVVYEAMAREPRIGHLVPLRPGEPISGGTLLRDARYLSNLAELNDIPTSLIQQIPLSNDCYKRQVLELITSSRMSLTQEILVVGFAYKLGSNISRDTFASIIIKTLLDGGAVVNVLNDPKNLTALAEHGARTIDYTPNLPYFPGTVIICAETPHLTDLIAQYVAKAPDSYFIDFIGFFRKTGLGHTPLHVFGPLYGWGSS